MNTLALCPFEQAFQSENSPGPVAADELLCRGIYANHIRGSNFRGWLRIKEIPSGNVSVWRKLYIGDTEEVATLLDKRGQKPLMRVVSVQASQLRSLRLADGRRAICIVDDTRDGDVSTHIAHAALASCREIAACDIESPEIMEIYEALRNLYEDAVVWQRAA